MSEGNGRTYDFGEYADWQEQKFGELEKSLDNGFQQLADSIRTLAQEIKDLGNQGYIPLSVLEKILEAQKQTTLDILAQQKEIVIPIVRWLCIALMGLLSALIGLKYVVPIVSKMLGAP